MPSEKEKPLKILLTGANGYIGSRLLLRLVREGHHVYALARTRLKMEIPPECNAQIHLIEGDLLNPASLEKIPQQINVAYYLVHSMGDSKKFAVLEAESAKNFRKRLDETQAKQIIYLSGLANESELSPHLTSRKKVGEILREGKVPTTILMAGIIVGSGSASFEIIRDLVEKLPFMVAPKWLKKLTQPIAVRDVLDYLLFVLDNPACFNQSFEIGGPDVMSYKRLLEKYAETRKLKRKIFTVPVLTPRLSSYWLVFITSTSFSLARFLVDSLINNAVCMENRMRALYPKRLLTCEEAIRLALNPLEEDWVPEHWTAYRDIYRRAPRFGTLVDKQAINFLSSCEAVKNRVWSLGGDHGWPSVNWAWRLRGYIDKLAGGIGFRKGRLHPSRLNAGDPLDFWRVLVADEKSGHLLLYAEMKLPGEAWLEFKIVKNQTEGGTLYQTATFRPKGLLGRFYWTILFPVHKIIFHQMARRLAKG